MDEEFTKFLLDRTDHHTPSDLRQELVSEEKDEASEAMGRVDEGVEEFFTKKVIFDYAPKGQWEESNPAQATPPESSVTPSSTTPLSPSSDITTPSTTTVTSPCVESDLSFPSPDVSAPCPPSTHSVSTTAITVPTKNIKKKFGDFFAFKRARVGRAARALGGDDGGVEVVKVKKSSIADFIRPLRESRERERDKEKKKESGKGPEEDANHFYDATIKEETVSIGCHFESYAREKIPPAKTLTTAAQFSETSPSHPTITTSSDLSTSGLLKLEDAAVPVVSGRIPSPEVISLRPEQEMQSGGSPFEQKRLRVAKRLREGKSQSLILLTGLEPEEKDNTPSKKHASESTPGFEQKLQVMLQRMGVAKTPPAGTKMCQNRDEEMRKANSEGAILDKPEPPPPHTKPRTMSTSSAEPRHLLRAQDLLGPEPLLHPKPAIPYPATGPLPPKPSIAAKPPLPTPGVRPSSAPAASSPVDQVLLTAQGTAEPRQNGSQDGAQGVAPTLSPRKEVFSSVQTRWSEVSAQGQTEKAQSVTGESLPKPCPYLKPLPQRRAVSVHEDTLAMTQELKAVLQRSPVHCQGNRGLLPSCSKDEAHRTDASDSGKQWHKEKEDIDQMEELKAKRGRTGFSTTAAEKTHPLPEKEDGFQSAGPSVRDDALQEMTAHRIISSKAPFTVERPAELTQTAGQSPGNLAPQGKSTSTASPPPQEHLSSTTPAPIRPTETPGESPEPQQALSCSGSATR